MAQAVFSGSGPRRISAVERRTVAAIVRLSALPEPIRQGMVDQFNRASDRFAAMISDGIAEGSLRAVDPSIAAQMLNATLNGAADLPFVIPGLQGAEMGKLYAKPMLMGIFER